MTPKIATVEIEAPANVARLPRIAAAPDANLDGVELIDAAGLKPEPIRWLWPGWIARGKLHVLAGAPGTGKTTLATHIAACVSAGTPLPSGWRPERGRVLIWSGEDDPVDTLVPRLMAAGADLSRVQFVGQVRDADGQRYPFDPARDVPRLAAALVGKDDVKLIVVDPLVSAVAGDSHKNAEVRRSLQPLVDLAVRMDAALIGITHYSKGTQGREPLERVSGSLAFGALARVVLGTVRMKSDDDSERRMMLSRCKSNIGPDGGGFPYAFEQTELADHNRLSASRIVWGAAVEGTARELLAEAEPDDDHETRDASDWLRDLLADGPLPVKDVRKHCEDAGHAWRTVQRAMRAAGVESKRGGFGMPATWALASRATVAPVAPTKILGANGANGGELARMGGFPDDSMEAIEL